MSVNRARLRQLVAERASPYVSGTADRGSVVSLVDAGGLQDSGASADLWEGAWLHISAGTNAGETRRVTSYDPVGGSVTVNRAFASAVDATSAYELARTVSPDAIHQALNDTLARCWYRTMALVTLAADGDMEDAATSSWTPAGASVAKVAASHEPLAGARALQVTNSRASGYAAADRVATLEGQRFALEAWVAPGRRTAELTVRNATAGSTLDAAAATGVAWRPLRLAFEVPPGCDEIEIRLGGAEADAVTTWDNLALLRGGRRQYPLPEWLSRRQQALEVWRRRTDSPGSDVMQAAAWWRLVPTPVGGGPPFWLEVDSAPGAGEVLIIEALRPYAPLTGDSSTTTAPSDWIVQGALAEVYGRLRREAPAGDAARYEALQREAARTFQQLARLYQPRVVRRVMLPGSR